MTMTVKHDDGHEVQACEQCRCEIGYGRAEPFASGVRSGGKHGKEVALVYTTPVYFDQSCACHCHDSWRIMYGHALVKGAEAAA